MFKQNNKNTLTLLRALFIAILLTGLFMRFYQYLMGRSLWHDEAALALNFVDLDYEGLKHPLLHFQMAPIGFLYAVETCTRLFSFGELSLRLVPFLFSIFSFPLFYFLVLELTQNKFTSLVAFFIFATNIFLIYYSSEVKPYTIDCTAYITMFYLLISRHRYVAKHRLLLIAAAGVIFMLFSNTSLLVLACVLLYLIHRDWRLKRNSQENKFRIEAPLKQVYLVMTCALFFLYYYFNFLKDHPYSKPMVEEWYSRFCPTPLFHHEFNVFMKERIIDTFFSCMFYIDSRWYFGYAILLIIVLAIAHLFYAKKYRVLFFAAFPILLHFVLSMAYLYPFFHRFILYLMPAFIILMAVGITLITEFIVEKIHWLVAGLFTTFCLFMVAHRSVSLFPQWDIRIKPAIAYINEHYPNTNILVTTPRTMYEFYYKTGLAKNGRIVPVKWNLSPIQYLWSSPVRAQRGNYVLLHSIIGGDGADSIINYLAKRHMIIKQYHNNNFGVTEVRPIDSLLSMTPGILAVKTFILK